MLLMAASMTLKAQLQYDSRLGQSIEALPDVEVTVSSDRTEFSAPAPVVADIAAPDLPAVEVAIPDAPAQSLPPPDAIMLATPVPSAPAARPAASQPALPAPPVIVMQPADLPARPPVIAAPLPPLPAPVPAAPAAATAALDAGAVEAAFDQIGRMQAVPAGVLDTLRAFYTDRGHTPLWLDGAALSTRATAVLGLIERADEHGMEPRRSLMLRTAVRTGEPALRDVALSVAAVQYARDARGGRLNPREISKLITATPSLPEARSVIEGLVSGTDPARALEAYHPRHAGYHALKAKLASLRTARAPAPEVPGNGLTHGATLRLGMVDDRVPVLRSVLGLPAVAHMRYDRDLVAAVRAAQQARGLKANGRLDAATVAALGGPPVREASRGDAIGDVIANMERWRWLPVDLGASHVFVNIPSFALTFQRNGERAFQTRVIVGKPQTPTPIFSDKVQFLVVNPYWNVPPSIALKEMLPLLQKNPYALQARGLQVVRSGKVVDPATIDWSGGARSVAIRQPPGERNALGHIKFMFPNEHAVYLHDTPSRGLFSRDVRAFSHGCVRVENPFALADALMGETYSERQLKSMIGGPERNVRLEQHVPVHLAYFTTFVDGSGELVNFPDLYGHNRRMKSILGL